jgi:hypothetical protein
MSSRRTIPAIARHSSYSIENRTDSLFRVVRLATAKKPKCVIADGVPFGRARNIQLSGVPAYLREEIAAALPERQSKRSPEDTSDE